jgi:glycosyltransferase involved in cell wall biosynthesis
MHVIHVITRLIVGGAQENTIASVLRLQARPGVRVELVSGPTTGPEGSLEKEFTQAGGTLAIIPELVRPVHPPKDFLALRALTRLFRERRPDIVHTHSGKAGILGRLAAARAGVPVIIHHIHGPSFGPFQGAPANLVFTAAERHAARVTTHFVCSAGAMTRLYLEAGIGRPEMYSRVFSGFDVQPFIRATNDPALRQRRGIAPDDFVIGKISRLFPLKGHADLFAAFAEVLPRCPRARLLLVGGGSLDGELKALARRLGLHQRITFTGLVPPGDVPALTGIMDCLVHLSYREALSRALPQALAAGKPVIAYDFDGADEICLENETGFLVRTGDTTAVANRLRQLAGDAALRERLGRHGQEFVRENFAVEKMVETLYRLYLRLMEKTA